MFPWVSTKMVVKTLCPHVKSCWPSAENVTTPQKQISFEVVNITMLNLCQDHVIVVHTLWHTQKTAFLQFLKTKLSKEINKQRKHLLSWLKCNYMYLPFQIYPCDSTTKSFWINESVTETNLVTKFTSVQNSKEVNNNIYIFKNIS